MNADRAAVGPDLAAAHAAPVGVGPGPAHGAPAGADEGTPDARLTALRLVGFKSFAERTLVEFGPGISAVVGPNGSGKSNLADALRWTLGEAGRSLRTRRAEDVIFAGSSSRRAIGMADVTLVIDNRDRLLPVDFEEVELGRRLYRSGENEYLLNRQRVRLRDLLELLDAGNLADNAFLFIGQGMVDQALALRPEERRPLFEEAAGVRRHERRRRQAENELAQAESNLERVRDVLAELRPQAKRLSAQAEQLQARRTAGLELAEALVAAARARWAASSAASRHAAEALARAHAESDAAMAELRTAEERAERLSAGLGLRAVLEGRCRDELERVRTESMEIQLRQARVSTEQAALARERQRHEVERAAIERRMAEARPRLAEPLPTGEESLTAELAEVDAELRRLADDDHAGARAGERAADLRRDRAALEARLAEQRRLSSTLATRATDARRAAEAAERQLGAAARERDAAAVASAAATDEERAAESALAAARSAVDAAVGAHAERSRALTEVEARVAAGRARVTALDAILDSAVDEAFRRAARARGGSLVAEGVEIEPRFRTAVAAALGDAAGALALPPEAVTELAGGRGVLVAAQPREPSAAERRTEAALAEAAAEVGGGLLAAAVRRDPSGHVTRLLSRTAWAPDLATAMALWPSLAPGWRVVTPDGEVLTDDGVVRLGGRDSFLEQRAERDELARSLEQLEPERAQVGRDADAAAAARAEAESGSGDARRRLEEARREHRIAEEAERVAERRAERLLREVAWLRGQADRLESERRDLEQTLAHLEAQLGRLPAGVGDGGAAGGDERVGALRDRRARLAAVIAQRRAARAAAEETRRRAEITLAMDESRVADLDAESARLAGRDAELAAAAERLASELAQAKRSETRARTELEEVVRAGADDRAQLQGAERAALAAREKLRLAEGRSRSAEVSAMEARLQLEQVREQLLVELAGIGRDALAALRAEAGLPPADGEDLAPDVLGTRLEEALDAALEHWQRSGPGEAAPSTGRLAALRRRFHELGAGNPFAVEEHREVSARLESLEAQRADLEAAIASTRELIANLSELVSQQFRATFAALEDAFSRRFRQLFDGGEAQLSLTAPDDLSTTGVEITARPPGKKRQPLAMLSGGERALTAVALLLAMLEVRPVPFCVLDEVDAALDEANIGRFSAALRSLSARIQFIVITHNRGTIEAADALYGVTIGEDAVSRIVSLRLPSDGATSAAEARGQVALAAADG